MASFRKRSSKWEYRVSYLDKDGEQKIVSHGGFRTKQLASAAAEEVEKAKRNGGDLSNRDVTLADYWDAWVARYKTGKHTMITEKRYPIIGKELRAGFGNRLLREVRPSEWQDFMNQFGETRSRSTAQRLNGYVRSMVKNAINDQLISVDFTLNVELSGSRGKSEADKFLQADELQAIMTDALSHASYNNISNCLIYLGAVSGARYSELVGLTWGDVDWDSSLININKTWDYHFGQGFQPTKTPSSVRTVSLTPEAMALLHRLKSEQTAYYIRTGRRDDLQMVFRNKQNTVPTNAAANKALRAIEDRVEKKMDRPLSAKITFHGLRHSHVSFLLSRNVDIYYISKRLGHSDITITLRVYSHMLDDSREKENNLALEALESLEN
ncbi:site-specific integrase [Lacticaseibacillus suibinensis]|uniref:site-specific integrase n=1 Tax=Lacticaseibacillus suibinensis TaxID=2486011 RepID=UPI0019443A5B|nr:site-specific integrase [Lacticaseibacillus suibinensis]